MNRTQEIKYWRSIPWYTHFHPVVVANSTTKNHRKKPLISLCKRGRVGRRGRRCQRTQVMSSWVSLKAAGDDKTLSTELDILIEKYGFKKPVWKTKVGLFQTVNKFWSIFFVNWLKRPIGYK